MLECPNLQGALFEGREAVQTGQEEKRLKVIWRARRAVPNVLETLLFLTAVFRESKEASRFFNTEKL